MTAAAMAMASENPCTHATNLSQSMLVIPQPRPGLAAATVLQVEGVEDREDRHASSFQATDNLTQALQVAIALLKECCVARTIREEPRLRFAHLSLKKRSHVINPIPKIGFLLIEFRCRAWVEPRFRE